MKHLSVILFTFVSPAIGQTIDDSGLYDDPVHPGQAISIERDGHDGLER